VFGLFPPTLAGNVFGGALLFSGRVMRSCAKRSTRVESVKP